MHDLSLLSEAQKRRIKPYLPLSHDIPRVDDRGYSAGSLSSSGMDCVGAMLPRDYPSAHDDAPIPPCQQSASPPSFGCDR